MKKSVKIGIFVGVLLLWAAVFLYVTTPAIHFKNVFFMGWLALTAAGAYILYVALFFRNKGPMFYRSQEGPMGVHTMVFNKDAFPSLKPLKIIGILVVVYFLASVLSSAVILRSKAYASQMPINELPIEEFGQMVSPESVGSSTLPIIDEDIARRKAEARLGTYGSQYTISDSFTLIHYNDNGTERLVRVAPLEYSGFFVGLNRYYKGSVGYVMVDVVTEEATLVEVEGGMPYLETTLFNKNLKRHIWFQHPFSMVTDYSFEIDDNGHPYWVATYFDYGVGLSGGPDPKGVILCDAVTGETQKYPMAEVPEWVDRVVPVEMAYEQANNAFTYKNGWFNAHFGAKVNVFNLSQQYNFLSLDGRTYMYSGVTSPNDADETSVGFIMTDLRTKDTSYFRMQGVTEARAMDIARNHQTVKAQNLTPTDPLLINIEGVPTYFLTLKNGYQRQWYVLVRVSDGTLAMNMDLKAAKTEYISLLSSTGNLSSEEMREANGTVLRLLHNGDNVEFLLQENPAKMYIAPLSMGIQVKFMQEGDAVTVRYLESGDGTGLVRELVNHSIGEVAP